MSVYKPPQGKYLPPKKRETELVVSLSSADFPEFGSVNGSPKTALNFKQQVLTGEEARQKALEASIYDSTDTRTMNHQQLVKEGWAVLPFHVPARFACVSSYGSTEVPRSEIELFLESLQYNA
jgi:hypothetical protein